jgi:hypothetical protein
MQPDGGHAVPSMQHAEASETPSGGVQAKMKRMLKRNDTLPFIYCDICQRVAKCVSVRNWEAVKVAVS